MNTLTFNCTVNCFSINPVKFAIKLEKLNDGLQKVIISGKNMNTKTITFSNPNNIPDPSLEITLNEHCDKSEQDEIDSSRELHHLSPSYQKAVEGEMKYCGRSRYEAERFVDGWTIW